MNKTFMLLVSFFSSFLLFSNNKIIYLVAPPRSLSTVFLRSVYARDDFQVYSEPCEPLFHLAYDPENSWVSLDDLLFKSYEHVKQELLSAREHGHVFAKDTPYSVREAFYDDEDFLADPDVEFVFLIRNPHDALISLYNALGYYEESYLDWVNARKMYEFDYELLKKIERIKGRTPLIISSEELSSNAYNVMHQFCGHIGIEFQESMISWPVLGREFDLKEWNMATSIDACFAWYKTTLCSTHFMPCAKDHDCDDQGCPTFIELPAKDRDEVKNIYDLQMNFYTKMKGYL